MVHPEAHHFAFITPFPDAMVDDVGAPARDPAGFDRRAFLAEIDGQILVFWTVPCLRRERGARPLSGQAV